MLLAFWDVSFQVSVKLPVVTGGRRSSREHGIATGADGEDEQGWFGDMATVCYSKWSLQEKGPMMVATVTEAML